MCARYTSTTYAHDWRAFYDIADPPAEGWRDSWNVAPTSTVAAVRMNAEGERVLSPFRWGLIPSWAKDRKIATSCINARGETVATKPAFRSAYKRRRCLVVMDGYYEWTGAKGEKQPHLIYGETPLAAAGLWEKWTDPTDGSEVESCTIITTVAAPSVRALHDRMPVFVMDERKQRHWLADDTPLEVVGQLLLPLDGLCFRPVSKRVNKVGNEGPDLLQPDTGI